VAILEAVTGSEITELTAAFNRLLVNKGRESYMPEIITAFIEQYKHHNKIQTVHLTTAIPVSEDLKKQIIREVQQQAGNRTIDLTTAVDESIIGGFKLEIGDTLVDASISYDLNKIKAQFLNNDFIYKIR